MFLPSVRLGRKCEKALHTYATLYTMSDLYKAACAMFIRPPRAEYSPTEMGPKEFDFIGRGYEREDVRVKNNSFPITRYYT